MEYHRLTDSTLLAPDAREEQSVALAKEAKELQFASVCSNPCFIKTVKDILDGTDVKVCTVIGFPLGAMTTESKVFETRDAIEKGAQEIDMVINVSALKDGKDDYVEEEIRCIKECCGDKVLKVILECCLLTDEEKVRACLLAKRAGADFVKTSTGFSKGGATVEDVALMRKAVGEEMGVKAAGGIRDRKTMLAMVEAGATRIGTSRGKALIEE